MLDRAVVGARSIVGPFARLRPDAKLHEDVHVGNFVEVKKSELMRGAKANHLTYLGDATVGEKVNVGAGTITCNYDGVNKWRTEIGAGAFIGSGTMLVAPVKVGAGATIGAGSTITKDTPDGQAHARAQQAGHDRELEASGEEVLSIRRATDSGMQRLDALEPGCWIHAVSPSVEDLAAIREFGVPVALLSHVDDPDERPRAEHLDDVALVVVHCPQRRSATEGAPFVTSPLSVFLLPHGVVTIAPRPVEFLDPCSTERSRSRPPTRGTRIRPAHVLAARRRLPGRGA